LAKPSKDPRGRKERDPREVLNGILWILRTGAPWKDLPQRYPPYQTCHRRFQQWARSGVFRRIAQELAEDLSERNGIDIREAFIDGTFVPAKKGVLLSARQSVAKAPRSWPSQALLVFLSPLTLKVYQKAQSRNPNRWSKEIRNWDSVDLVWLNLEKKNNVSPMHRLKKAV
jgi:transposase